jgi:serine/threonine-protein kinase PpkA
MDIKGYKIQDQIGQGGMAIVYRAIQESLDRPVALKVMNPLFAENPQFTKRFLAEGRLLASLHHNNIITIYDIGVCDNLHYISMEYVDGGDLKQRIREGITPLTALDYTITIGSCLQVAHAAKIVHRDVKPVNILFRSDDTLLLTDFGIAKQLIGRKNITVTGSLVGSPYYLSPEQALGGDIDGRSDIYSLGILLFEMLMGKRPFDGDSQIDVALKHIEGNLPTLPPRLSHFQPLLDKMTAKQKHDRFRDARSMIQEAQKLRDSHQWDNGDNDVVEHQSFSGFDDTTVLYVGDEDEILNEHAVQARRPVSAPDSRVQESQQQTKKPFKAHPQASDQPVGQNDNHSISKIFGSVKMGGIAAGLCVLALFTTLLTVGLPDFPGKTNKTDVRQEKNAFHKTPIQPETIQPETPPSKPIEHTFVEYPQTAELIQYDESEPRQPVNLDMQPINIQPEPIKQPNPAKQMALDDGHAKIDRLLTEAQRALSEYRLTTPAGNNAYDYYQQVLLAEPENSEANQGVSHIADRYLQLARSALQAEQSQKAELYVERGLQVKKDHAGLLALRVELVNQQIQLHETANQQKKADSVTDQYPSEKPTTPSDSPKASFFQRLMKKLRTQNDNFNFDSEYEQTSDNGE